MQKPTLPAPAPAPAPTLTPSPRPARVAVALALFLVYVVWGSTYLAIRIALTGFPPLFLAATRFLVAGGVLYAFLRARGAPAPTREGWGAALRVGFLLLTVGNAGVVVAEQRVASGLAATVVASVPLFAALFNALLGNRPRPREILGIAIGVGSVCLVQVDGQLRGDPAYAAVLLVSTASWAYGSVRGRTLPMPKGLMGSAASMLCGGAVLSALSVATGQWPVTMPPAQSFEALLYLIVMGSMVAYSAYAWLLQSVPSALATSYAYVNPIIALGLGAALMGEHVGASALVATVGILAGVALVSIPARSHRGDVTRRQSADAIARGNLADRT